MPPALFEETDLPAQVRARVRSAPPTPWEALDADTARLGVAKLRLAGVYDDRQSGRFMLRTRIPGGLLTSEQADVLSGVALDFGARPDGETQIPDRITEITTRQDLQLHWIRFEDLPEIWARFDAVGLTSLQACGDTLRNITSCPVAGLDSSELLDARPVVDAVTRLSFDDPQLTAFLPRKFKVAVTGCPTDCVAARLHDLAFTPARLGGILGFNVHVGGGLSDYPRLASAIAIFVEPDRVPQVVRAALEVFRDLGDPEYKAVNRFRMLVHELGVERITVELRGRLPFATSAAGDDLSTWRADDHLGVHPDAAGRSYVGVCVPVGRLGWADLAEVARLARVHGDGGIRLTQRQNLIFTGVANVDALLAEPLLARFSPYPDPFERGVLACTAAPFCKFGLIDSKTVGSQLIETLRAAVPASQWDRLDGLRIHVSGCKASCAQTQAAHIGLRGTSVQDGDRHIEAVDIAVGGGPDRLARWAEPGVPLAEVTQLLTRALSDTDAPDALSEQLLQTITRGVS